MKGVFPAFSVSETAAADTAHTAAYANEATDKKGLSNGKNVIAIYSESEHDAKVRESTAHIGLHENSVETSFKSG